ncbi:hypothetical protein BDA99DRAFT_534493 [Phascolomyces articulosus]|uniref:Uncharacterized protein n=1 Tax=Phascolomyces articulosus TaxID=60185 RepID=A0AAD5K595_9FUNG|nr:hypothetical protein BDA99DRAFT_534493 [Phascolomyces articulosus]
MPYNDVFAVYYDGSYNIHVFEKALRFLIQFLYQPGDDYYDNYHRYRNRQYHSRCIRYNSNTIIFITMLGTKGFAFSIKNVIGIEKNKSFLSYFQLHRTCWCMSVILIPSFQVGCPDRFFLLIGLKVSAIIFLMLVALYLSENTIKQVNQSQKHVLLQYFFNVITTITKIPDLPVFYVTTSHTILFISHSNYNRIQ